MYVYLKMDPRWYLDYYLLFLIVSKYDMQIDPKINVGHCNIFSRFSGFA